MTQDQRLRVVPNSAATHVAAEKQVVRPPHDPDTRKALRRPWGPRNLVHFKPQVSRKQCTYRLRFAFLNDNSLSNTKYNCINLIKEPIERLASGSWRAEVIVPSCRGGPATRHRLSIMQNALVFRGSDQYHLSTGWRTARWRHRRCSRPPVISDLESQTRSMPLPVIFSQRIRPCPYRDCGHVESKQASMGTPRDA